MPKQKLDQQVKTKKPEDSFWSRAQAQMQLVPFSFVGVSLALIALGSLWKTIGENTYYHGTTSLDFMAPLMGAIGVAILLAITICGVAFNFKTFWKALTNSVSSGHVGVLFSTYLAAANFIIGIFPNSTTSFAFYFGNIIWWAALVIQVMWMILWTYVIFINFKKEDIDAAWIVPAIGLVIADLTTPNMVTVYGVFLKVIWIFNFITMIIFSALILYRYIYVKKTTLFQWYGFGLFVVNAPLLLSSYFLVFGQDIFTGSGVFITIFLLALTITFIFVNYLSFIKTLFRAFSIRLTIYSFANVAASTSLIITANAFSKNPYYDTALAHGLTIFAFVHAIITTIYVAYVTLGNFFYTIVMFQNSKAFHAQKPITSENMFVRFFVTKDYNANLVEAHEDTV